MFFQKALHRVRCNHQIILPDYSGVGGLDIIAIMEVFCISRCKSYYCTFAWCKLKQLQVAVPPMELQEQFAVFVAQTDKSKVAVRKY